MSAQKIQIIHEVGDYGYPEELSEKDQKSYDEQLLQEQSKKDD